MPFQSSYFTDANGLNKCLTLLRTDSLSLMRIVELLALIGEMCQLNLGSVASVSISVHKCTTNGYRRGRGSKELNLNVFSKDF